MKRIWKFLIRPEISWLELIVILTVSSTVEALGPTIQRWYNLIAWCVIVLGAAAIGIRAWKRRHEAR